MLVCRLTLLVILSFVTSFKPPCAYWCEGSCTKKVTSFYCCSYEPSLTGPKRYLKPPCTNLCLNRSGNDPAYLRNCKMEMEALQSTNSLKFCRNFNDCDSNLHDLCCSDKCLPQSGKMCVKL